MPPLPPSSLTPENMRPRSCTNAATAPGDKAILASGELVIEALEHAMNLQEVVEQLERGDVQRIRDKYGPQQGRASDRIWPRIKVTVNRRERLYHQLKDPGEFNSDKERFFKFFTATNHTSMPAGGRKRKVVTRGWYLTVALSKPFRIVTRTFEKREGAQHTGMGLGHFPASVGMRGGVI